MFIVSIFKRSPRAGWHTGHLPAGHLFSSVCFRLNFLMLVTVVVVMMVVMEPIVMLCGGHGGRTDVYTVDTISFLTLLNIHTRQPAICTLTPRWKKKKNVVISCHYNLPRLTYSMLTLKKKKKKTSLNNLSLQAKFNKVSMAMLALPAFWVSGNSVIKCGRACLLCSSRQSSYEEKVQASLEKLSCDTPSVRALCITRVRYMLPTYQYQTTSDKL